MNLLIWWTITEVTTGGIANDKTALKIEQYDALFGVSEDDIAAATKKRDADRAATKPPPPKKAKRK